jgi:hypothetical protein
MKKFPFVQMVIAALLMVAVVSCTTVREVYDEDEDGYYSGSTRTAPGRIYVDDPYYGTIVMERDPFTGRYYQVGPYNGGYSSRYGTSNSRYRNNDPYYNSQRRGGYSNGGGRTYRNPTTGNTTTQQPSPEVRKQAEEKKTEARRKVFGN